MGRSFSLFYDQEYLLSIILLDRIANLLV